MRPDQQQCGQCGTSMDPEDLVQCPKCGGGYCLECEGEGDHECNLGPEMAGDPDAPTENTPSTPTGVAEENIEPLDDEDDAL